MPKKVAILGGGVAGMSAAHELIKHGFDIEVYEKREIPGGKARSFVIESAKKKLKLPAEHGFRLFPGFYRHLDATMRDIPYGTNRGNVFQNLQDVPLALVAREGKSEVLRLARFPRSRKELQQYYKDFKNLSSAFAIRWSELVRFALRLLVFLSSSERRRVNEYERTSWWKFTRADAARSSQGYKDFVGDATRILVAARGRDTSARSGGSIAVQLLMQLHLLPRGKTDRVLNGPTNCVWIDPWLAYLTAKGVQYHTNTTVEAINFDTKNNRVAGVTVVRNEGGHAEKKQIEADYYIAALPVEVMQKLVTEEMKQTDQQFAHLHQLQTEWMTGIQFYLSEDVDLVDGHVFYLRSPWALTSISQRQFWPNFDLTRYGNGSVRGILSVDISDWKTPGVHIHRKPAQECSRQEVAEEVWAQLKAFHNDRGKVLLKDEDLVDWCLDPAIKEIEDRHSPVRLRNEEPLLVNTVGSWANRPEACTEISNFFLASDYVRTYTDLATMEAANEAARRAVRGILKAEGQDEEKCKIFPLQEPYPFIFGLLKGLDSILFICRLPNVLAVLLTVLAVLLAVLAVRFTMMSFL